MCACETHDQSSCLHSDALRSFPDPRRRGAGPHWGALPWGIYKERAIIAHGKAVGMAWLHAQQGNYQRGKPVTLQNEWWLGSLLQAPCPAPCFFPNRDCLGPCPCFTDRPQTGFEFLRGHPTLQDALCAVFADPLRPPGQPNSGPEICGLVRAE